MLKKEVTFFFNSSEEAGAVKLNNLGNKFEVSLNNAIHIPPTAKYCSLYVPTSAIWNNSPNISQQIGNNKFHFAFEVIPGSVQPYEITIPDGLYSVTELDNYFKDFLENEPNLPDDLFEIEANDSIQRIVIILNYDNILIDFSQPNSVYELLGFNQTFLSNTIGSYTAPNVAKFNRVISYFIKTNLLSSGIPQNSKASGIITDIPITASTGSLINFEPKNPIRADANELIGNPKQTFYFHLVDQLERDVSTFGEEWSLSLVIEYLIEA